MTREMIAWSTKPRAFPDRLVTRANTRHGVDPAFCWIVLLGQIYTHPCSKRNVILGHLQSIRSDTAHLKIFPAPTFGRQLPPYIRSAGSTRENLQSPPSNRRSTRHFPEKERAGRRYAATCNMSPPSTLCVIDRASSAAKLAPPKLAMAWISGLSCNAIAFSGIII